MKYFLGALLSLSLAGAACNQIASTIDGKINQPFTIAPGQHASVESLQITLQSEIQDSRCASDVVCIRAGEVIVKVDVTDEGKGPQTLALAVPKGGQYSDQQSIDGYTITLKDVTPYPKTTVKLSPQDYRATIVVTKP